jgi:uncharacterized membrane protein YkvA (DUF1232 family)
MLRLRRLLKSTGTELLVLWHVCRHRDTPVAIKLGAIILAVYCFSPIDFIPDALLGFGWIDDISLLALLVPFLVKRAPPEVLQSARAAAERFRRVSPSGSKP